MDDLLIWELLIDAWAALGRHFEPVLEKAGRELSARAAHVGFIDGGEIV